ncbi:MAG: hypothetical protein AMXMBFR13_09500 [Phycisphaerae bacterium]
MMTMSLTTVRPGAQRGGIPRTRAFSLIEVLVVVSIVALLAAILLPALSGARNQARRLRCMSHLRATGNAMNYYKAQAGHYPRVMHSAQPHWIDQLCMLGRSVAKTLVKGALGEPNAMFCPSSVENDQYAPRPFGRTRIFEGGGYKYVNSWETGEISYISLTGACTAYAGPDGVETFDWRTESPQPRDCLSFATGDVRVKRDNPRAVLMGDRVRELKPFIRNVARSNHGREGGWFYFAAGNVEWWSWNRLTAHHSLSFDWYWPRTAGPRSLALSAP